MHRKDTAALVIPAHTLKSEARQFGAEPLGELAEEIEFTARRSIEMRVFPDELVPAVAKLRPLYERTMELFAKETNPLVERRATFGRAGAHNQNFGRIQAGSLRIRSEERRGGKEGGDKCRPRVLPYH